jgi:hypothetical protein
MEMKDYKIARKIWRADGYCQDPGKVDCRECPLPVDHPRNFDGTCARSADEAKQVARDFYKKWLQGEIAAVEADEKK